MTTEVASFSTEPMLDLHDPRIQRTLLAALAELDESLPVQVRIHVAGEKLAGSGEFTAHDPAWWERVTAEARIAGEGDVSAAVKVAVEGQPAWAAASQEHRSGVLREAARLLRARRPSALALLVRECGKTWIEADAEYCEAIDFLEYYASAALDHVAREQLLQGDGEQNTLSYTPRGVAGVIIPWNFPLAIGLGMTVGPLVMGNASIVKPAEQTPAVGQFLYQVLVDAGVPVNVLALLPGAGDTGAALVAHPNVETILFTGSRQVGLHIIERAGKTGPQQRQVKKVVAEMGGKNCVVIDETADLDGAVDPILRSAFAFAGQKCSAASRVLVHRSAIDGLSERLAKALREFKVGLGEEFDTDVTALIEPEAMTRVRALIDRALNEGTLVAQVETIPSRGCFVAPTIVRDLPASSPLLQEEVFGPLLTLEPYDELGEALDRIDSLPYALTGGVFSTSPATISEVTSLNPAGNLYVNRKITGAFVGRQPFGGNRMSGIGTKAGSVDYVLQFVHAKVVCAAEVAR